MRTYKQICSGMIRLNNKFRDNDTKWYHSTELSQDCVIPITMTRHLLVTMLRLGLIKKSVICGITKYKYNKNERND